MADSSFDYDKMLDMLGLKSGSLPGLDKATLELVALRNENKKLKEEIERLQNTILKCPCGKKLRIPVRKSDG